MSINATNEEGLATLETILSVLILVPLLFAVITFGEAFQRWLAQDAAVVQAARYAGELGGDAPEVRDLLERTLRDSGIDPALVEVSIEPSHVGWREPVTVRATSSAVIDVPFIFRFALPLRSSAVACGEVNR